jgi:uncharacterized membrane protein YqaE (UPF0057 family)
MLGNGNAARLCSNCGCGCQWPILRFAPMNTLILVIIAILLPPLAVFLKTKSAKDTIINIVLCIFFWLPGILHALWLILK